MNPKRSPLSSLLRRWEIVVLACAASLGWVYWTDQPPPPIHLAQVEIRWTQDGAPQTVLLPEAAESVSIGTLEDLDNLLRSAAFLKVVARESILSRFTSDTGNAGKPYGPEHFLSTEEAVSVLSQFETVRNKERNSILLSFQGPSKTILEERARMFGRTLLLLHSASVNRMSLEVRDFLRDRLADWNEREQGCTRMLWKLRGNAQIPTAGRVAAKPGGERAEAETLEPSIPQDGESLYQPIRARLGLPNDPSASSLPLADSSLEPCRVKLLEAQKLDHDLLGVQTRLAELERQLDPPPSNPAAIASAVQELNSVEADLIRFREERRKYEEAFHEFDLEQAPERVRSTPFQAAFRTEVVDGASETYRLRRYQIWGACGAAVGVVMAKLLDRTALSGSADSRREWGEKGSGIG